MPLHHSTPTATVQDFFSLEVFGYSVLQLTIAAFAIAGIIGGTRWAFRKALGKLT
jgi:hypothetical protein